MMKHRCIAVKTGSILLAWAIQSAAQSLPTSPLPPPEPPTATVPAPATLNEALDKALTDLRIAESGQQGAEGSEAFERATTYVGYVLERDSANPRARFYQARIFILRNRASEAISRLQDWTKSREGENDWEGHFILGRVYMGMEFWKLAEPSLKEASDLNPREPRIVRLLSQCKTRLLKRKEAIDLANQFVQMLGADADAEAVLLVAEALALNDQLVDAEASARRAKEMAFAEVRKDPTNVRALTHSEACIQMLIRIIQAKLKAAPDDADQYVEMAKLMQELADVASLVSTNNALRWAFEGLKKSADNPSEALLTEVVRLLARLGKIGDARALGEKALQRFPGSPEITRILAAFPPAVASEPVPSAAVHDK